MKKTIVIVGGGASGLFAALHAVNKDTRVIILEHKDRVGKKILMTGNGKCNLTNMSDIYGKYYSDHLEKVYQTVSKYDACEVRKFFKRIGLYTKEKRDGGVYPVSEQAATVLDVLRMECDRLGVRILTNCHVCQIEPDGQCGKVWYQNLETNRKENIHYDALIISTGSKAAKVSGSDGSGYELVKKIGHNVITPLPALVQLKCDGNYFKSVAGVRAQAVLKLYIDDKNVALEEGEIQLTDYGISGIPTFQISRMVSKALYENKKCRVQINFLPYLEKEEIQQLYMLQTKFGYKSIEELLYGLIHKKIAVMLCRQLQVKPDTKVECLSKKQWEACIRLLTDFEVKVTDTNPFDNAQVCCGGVPLNEIDENMQSTKCKNVYLVGEILDCDGICGGYNLQWAWATGAIAGMSAARNK